MSVKSIQSGQQQESSLVGYDRGEPPLYKQVSYFSNSPMLKRILRQAELFTLADVKVLNFVSRTQFPCYWEPKILAIVPRSKHEVYTELKRVWTELRNPIRDQIGEIHQRTPSSSLFWTNSAKSVEELLEDEQEGAKIFLNLCNEVTKNVNGQAHFGPDNCNITKTEESIRSKIARGKAESQSPESHVIQHMEDGVRGTLSFATPEQLKEGIQCFAELAEQQKWQVEYNNLWKNEEDYSGYLDIDVKIKIPLTQGRSIIAELQFHLEDFYDGTKGSIVSRAHKVYEILRMVPVEGKPSVNMDAEALNETSRLYFTTALFQTTKKDILIYLPRETGVKNFQ